MRTRLLPLLLVAALPAAGGAPDNDPERHHKMVFFAVLEGLYEDGVATEDVDAILSPDPETGYLENFVRGCPICDPACDAFRLYRGRPGFQEKKGEGTRNTFGKGLDAATREAILSRDPAKRFPAIEGLVRTWVARRLALLRLTEAEREGFTRAFEEMRKIGMSRIAGGAPAKMKSCALCDGATAACDG